MGERDWSGQTAVLSIRTRSRILPFWASNFAHFFKHAILIQCTGMGIYPRTGLSWLCFSSSTVSQTRLMRMRIRQYWHSSRARWWNNEDHCQMSTQPGPDPRADAPPCSGEILPISVAFSKGISMRFFMASDCRIFSERWRLRGDEIHADNRPFRSRLYPIPLRCQRLISQHLWRNFIRTDKSPEKPFDVMEGWFYSGYF